MSEEKFTKGEWCFVGLTADAFNDIGANQFSSLIEGNFNKGADQNELEANAHLIAAAPEMYAMLEDLRERIGFLDEEALGFVNDTPDQQGWFIREEILYNMDQLLSKARGEK